MDSINLKDMSTKELKELKDKWYRESKNKRDTIAQITRILGTAGNINVKTTFTLKVVSGSNEIVSYVNVSENYSTVRVNGDLVMSTFEDDKLFIRGEWVKGFIDSTIVRAGEREQELKKAAEEEERQELIDELSYTWK
jgi:hypothetical protein